MEAVQVFDEHCRHCRHNPKAEKPYDKMHRLKDEDGVTTKELEAIGKTIGVKNVSCVACYVLKDFFASRT